jgi:hypothetical protein
MTLWLVGCAGVLGAAELPPEHIEFFEAKIRPILVESCYKCHSVEAGKSKADLLLDSRDAVRKGGASGPVIVSGKPDDSLLIQAIRYKDEDLQMPPPDEGGKLSEEKIALLEEWVRRGAPDPRSGGKPHPMDMAAARQHWAFQPVVKPAVPGYKGSERVRDGGSEGARAIDAWVRAKLGEKGLSWAGEADKRTLLRRVTYDLTGLPPTAEEMDAFLADKSPEAYARVVERLLASPRYGERWGRFWLDVARFADTKGYLAGNVERRYTFSHTYRDYVIRAFNEDKPYDRFVVEQLAADQLELGDDKSALAALGFLTLGRRFLNNQNDIIDDRIDVVTRGLMGMTVTCARCHDHKFDPIPTKDYYSLHGVFASSEEPSEKPLLGPLVESPAYQEFTRKVAEIEAKIAARQAEEVQKFLAEARAETGDYLLAVQEAKRLKPTEKLDLFAGVRKLNVEVLRRWQSFLPEREAKRDPVLAPWFALVAEGEAKVEGDFAARAKELVAQWQTAGPAVDAKIAAAFAAWDKPIASLKDAAAVYNRVFAGLKKESGDSADEELRRLVFADGAPANLSEGSVADMIRREINNKTSALKREIEALNWTEPGAPLRAMALVDKKRVADSNVLLRGNPANRGPEVPRQFLEVLSGETRRPFAKGSGRMELAEEIVNPANPLTARVFVNRVWGWHFGQALVRTPSDFGVRTEAPVQRELLDWLAASFMESGWSVKSLQRWIVLSATYRQSSQVNPKAARLDPDNQLLHHFERRRLEFEAMRDTLLALSGQIDLTAGGLADDLTKEPFSRRRTVYGFIDRQNLPGMFRTFDFPNPDVSSAQRLATTVPQQALFMLNSPFVLQQARALVARPEVAGAKSPPDKVRALYRVVYQRAPERQELIDAQAFLGQPQEGEPARPAGRGWSYGFGAFDAAANRTVDFVEMAVQDKSRASPANAYPDSRFGHLSVTATGGHPGREAAYGSVRRWTAPMAGTVRIEGTLAHASEKGDGVRGWLVSSVRGKLGEWTVHHGKEVTNLAAVKVEPGETLDFVVGMIAGDESDSYAWAPNISYTGRGTKTARAWNARKDFGEPVKVQARLTREEELAQVLLMSNEVAFVD